MLTSQSMSASSFSAIGCCTTERDRSWIQIQIFWQAAIFLQGRMRNWYSVTVDFAHLYSQHWYRFCNYVSVPAKLSFVLSEYRIEHLHLQ